MNLFSTFNGTLFKSLCRVNQSLVLRNFRNVTRGPSHVMLQVDQARNSPSKKLHIPDMKIYETLQERISDGVLFCKFTAHLRLLENVCAINLVM